MGDEACRTGGGLFLAARGRKQWERGRNTEGLRKIPKGKINWRGFAWGEKTCQETPAVLEMRKSKSFRGRT